MAMMPHPRRRDRARGDSRSRPGARPVPEAPSWVSSLDTILSEFTERWERGEAPAIEEYLARLSPDPGSEAMELIYHAYCLAESAGLNPDPADYIARFPAQGRSLEQLFGLHRTIDSTQLRLWVHHWADPVLWPEAGDEIGPFLLLRELGEGGFAQVFLAEQTDLDRRLVVVKVSSRITPEPRLLARARHSHIVEVFWHSLIDDGAFQLICMPFLGGATLDALLADRKRRGKRPRSGRDLLAELDRVSAPEYPAANRPRPARAILDRLSYPKAVAQVVARLAEALDHAYRRGVLHGDVKPSNILLTADGTPMLLDFNLAVDWRLPVGDDLLGDTGGTLAYMAPERLQAFAQPEDAAVPTAAALHRADIYALGMVLLEALAGRTPDHPRGSPRSPRELALAFALSRQQGAETLIRSCRVALAPALRSIVTRCLAPDPADRYKHSSELAEDLDRWCGDRSLTFAREPHGCSGLFRWARRRRPAVAAALLSLVVGAVSTLGVWNAVRTSLQEEAQAKLSRLWDDVESKAFRFGRFGHWRHEESDSPEDASRHLADYHVLGDRDWRTRDEVHALPESERSELEVWLLEQSLRLGRALRQRPDSRDDWRRGLEVIERVVALRPLGPLESQCRLLRRQLGLPEPSDPTPRADPSPRWMEEYLLGVEAEPLRARDALVHYGNVLRERPESFWGHFRAATVAHRLHEWDAAADHLEHCIAQRPENPALRGLYAGSLYDLNRFDKALAECNKALELNPDFAQGYRTRAFIRNRLGQSEELKSDISRFELLTRRLGKVPSWRLRLDWMLFQQPGGAGTLDRALDGSDLPQRLLAADPEDVDMRTALASQLMDRGHPDTALGEFDKVLEINPDHLRARYLRGALLLKMRRNEAAGDFSYVLEHPRFEELLQETDIAIHSCHYESRTLLDQGEVDKALQVALRGLDLAYRQKTLQGDSHYFLARALAVAAKSDPEQLQQAAFHVWIAYRWHHKYFVQWFAQDSVFDSQRGKLDLFIQKLRDDFDRSDHSIITRRTLGMTPSHSNPIGEEVRRRDRPSPLDHRGGQRE